MNDELEDALFRLGSADHDEFATLALTAGLDPKQDFVGADLRGCDLSNQDLRDFDLRGADLRNCRFYRTVFQRDYIRAARFSTRKGFMVVAGSSSRRQMPSFLSSHFRYTDAIANVIGRISHIEEVDKKREFLRQTGAQDRRESIRRFISGALTTDKSLAAPSIAVPFLMDLALSRIYPLARGELIASFIRVLGENRHARAFLRYYHRERATGPKTSRMLREFLEEEQNG